MYAAKLQAVASNVGANSDNETTRLFNATAAKTTTNVAVDRQHDPNEPQGT